MDGSGKLRSNKTFNSQLLHNPMESTRFINNYEYFIDEIQSVVKPELLPIIEELKAIDPHDLVRPDTWFSGDGDARGFIWSIFIKKALYNSDIKKF